VILRWFIQPSVRRLVGLVVVAPVVVVCAVLATMTSLATHDIAEDLGATVLDGGARNLRAQVSRYLDTAMRVSDLYARRLARGELPARGDMSAWQATMLDDLAVHHDVASICFANDAGESTWLLRAHQRLEVGVSTGTGEGQAVEHVLRANGQRGEMIRRYRYVAPQRPWFTAAPDDGSPLWTPIYFWFGDSGTESTVGTGYTRVVYDDQGHRLGVLVIDVTLGGLSDFLRAMPLASHGYLFILDENHLLVATSHGTVNSIDGQRQSLSQLSGAGAQAAAAALRDDRHALGQRRIFVLDQPARLHVVSMDPYPGIQWRLVAVVPESVFMADAVAMQRRVVTLSVVALAGGVLLALLLARLISRPLLILASHLRRIGAGRLDTRLDLQITREFAELSATVNRMADDLKERLKLQEAMQVAQEVQQSLLPAQAAQVEGLDIACRNVYCDQTGGDYYDFIELSEECGTLVAIGDVMGHGIGAALIMAAARAALRTHCMQETHLGKLLDRVNCVLAAETRHVRFVTMMLASLDAQAGTLRWASAGHGTPLLFDPHRLRFIDADGGHVPLGIDADVSYDQYEITGLRPGCVLLLGTDGLWEATSERGKMFGTQRVKDLILLHHRDSAEGIACRLEEALKDFRGEENAADDVTFVVVKLTGVEE
jgi:serine phosphatase RsbU (regulator of sigma subunit)